MKRVDAVEFIEFEWDDENKRSHADDRQIDFVVASAHCCNHASRESSHRDGEVRTMAICWTNNSGGCIYTSGQVCRIISVRPARRMSKENIVRYSADEIRRMVANGETKTDWARVDA